MIGLEQAIEIIEKGLLVVYPTETVYGIGGSALDPHVLDLIREVKGTPPGAPVSIAVSGLDMARELAVLTHEEVLRRYLPGPFTFILPAATDLKWGGTVGIRMPDSAIALQLIDATGPITSTSANRHGSPPPSRPEEVSIDLPVLAGPPCRYGTPSAVVDLTRDLPSILREGPVPFQMEIWELG